MADTSANSVGNMEEPPYKKNLERLAALQDRLSKVQKTAESLLATVSGSGGDYTDKLVYTDVTRVSNYLAGNKVTAREDSRCASLRAPAQHEPTACSIPASSPARQFLVVIRCRLVLAARSLRSRVSYRSRKCHSVRGSLRRAQRTARGVDCTRVLLWPVLEGCRMRCHSVCFRERAK